MHGRLFSSTPAKSYSILEGHSLDQSQVVHWRRRSTVSLLESRTKGRRTTGAAYREQSQGWPCEIVRFDICSRAVTSLHFLFYHFPNGWVFVLFCFVFLVCWFYFCFSVILFLLLHRISDVLFLSIDHLTPRRIIYNWQRTNHHSEIVDFKVDAATEWYSVGVFLAEGESVFC